MSANAGDSGFADADACAIADVHAHVNENVRGEQNET